MSAPTSPPRVPEPLVARPGRPGGHELERFDLIDAESGEQVAALVRVTVSRRIPPSRLARDMAMGRQVTGVTEKADAWEAYLTDPTGRGVLRRVGYDFDNVQHAVQAVVRALAGR
jgi:hypothetical protein